MSDVLRLAREGVGVAEGGAARARGLPADQGLATIPEGAAVDFEERLLQLSAELLDSQIENASLKEAVGVSVADIAARMEALEAAAAQADAARGVAEERLATTHAELEDALGEMRALRANVVAKVAELRGARDRSAALQQQITEYAAMDLSSMSGSGGLDAGKTAGLAARLQDSNKRRLGLFELCLALRRRIALLTHDAAERTRMQRVDASEDELLAEPVPDGVSASGSVATSTADAMLLDAAGQPLSYTQLATRLRMLEDEKGQLRSSLAESQAHARALGDALAKAHAQASAAAKAAAATSARAGTSDGAAAAEASAAKAAAAAAQAEAAGLRQQVEALRAQLVKARDALVTARAAAAASKQQPQQQQQQPGGDDWAAERRQYVKQFQALKSYALQLQDKAGALAGDNEQLRSALAAAMARADAATAAATNAAGREAGGHGGGGGAPGQQSAELLLQLQTAERRTVELLSRNTVLQGQLDALAAHAKASVIKYERLVAGLRGKLAGATGGRGSH
jgi:predicted  nucleic acid-binding Zn-ribbon protein